MRSPAPAACTCPAIKGQPFLGCEAWDITEIKGADELYEAEGIIARSEANATALFGTARTYYSTEGSSQCIRAMLALALRRAPKTGKRPVLLAARNAHKALLLCRRPAGFRHPVALAGPGSIRGAVQLPGDAGSPAQGPANAGRAGRTALWRLRHQPGLSGQRAGYRRAGSRLQRRGACPCWWITPTGRTCTFCPAAASHPIALGAAMCCDSGHKTLPVLTGGAYLHLGPDAPVQDEATVRNTLNLFGSTSPSYLILQSLDQCNAVLAGDYRARLAGCCAALEALRKALNETAAAHGAVLPLALPGDPRTGSLSS